jgi:hypothetical protein
MKLWDYGIGRSDEVTRVVMALWDWDFRYGGIWDDM